MKNKFLIFSFIFVMLLFLVSCGTVCEKNGHNYEAKDNNDGTHTLVCVNDPTHTLVEDCSMGEWLVVKAAQEFEEGLEERVCSKCDHKEQRSIAPTHEHKLSAWTSIKDATCLEDGEEKRTCEGCEYFETRVVEKLGHDEVKHSAKNPTCLEIGYNEYVTCSRCDYTTYVEIGALGHTEVVDAKVEPTCNKTGLTEGKHCSVCNEVLVAQTEIEKLAHTEVVDAKVDPTCTETGLTEGKHCSVCNEVLVAQDVIDAQGHTEEVDAGVEATCTKTGLTEGKHCSVCNEVLVAQDVIDLVDHVYEVNTSPATCKDKGYDKYECINCDYEEIDEWEDMSCTVTLNYQTRIGLLGKYYDVYLINVNISGCGSDNYENGAVVMIKDLYGYNIKDIYGPTYINYNGEFNYSGNTINLEVGYYHTIYVNIDTAAGYGLSCEYDVYSGTYNIVFDSLHKYEDVITDPTKTEQGYTTHTCSVCSDSYVDTYTDPIGSQGLEYTINSDNITCEISGIGTCEDEDIYIPTYIDGYQVVSIGEKAFDSAINVKNIYISKTVTNIANKAFYKCSGIKEITIPETVNSIGTQIFMGCTSLETVYYNSSFAPKEGETFINEESIKKIVFGDNLTRIPSYICYNCRNLEEIILSSNTKTIGNYSFYYCTSVKEIELSEGLEYTGWYSFYEMTGLTEIVIPSTVTSIDHSFRGCRNLEKIVFPVSVITVNGQTFYSCNNIKEVYYTGDELEWESINVDEDSLSLLNATVYFYSESEPTEEGYYWHYVEGVVTSWE